MDSAFWMENNQRLWKEILFLISRPVANRKCWIFLMYENERTRALKHLAVPLFWTWEPTSSYALVEIGRLRLKVKGTVYGCGRFETFGNTGRTSRNE